MQYDEDNDETWVDRIKYFYWDWVPYDYRPLELWYRFKCFAWHRYTTVKPRAMGHTFMDRCVLLPHLIFEVLCNYFERECDSKPVVDTGRADRDKDYAELWDHYTWWTQTFLPCFGTDLLRDKHMAGIKPPEKFDWNAADDDPILGPYYAALRAISKESRDLDAEALRRCVRIVELSPHLWS